MPPEQKSDQNTKEDPSQISVQKGKVPASADQTVPSNDPPVTLSMPNFTGEIDRLQELVQAASDDPSATMSELEEVQKGLIDNLDRLNKYIEDYVEVLGNNRKMAS